MIHIGETPSPSPVYLSNRTVWKWPRRETHTHTRRRLANPLLPDLLKVNYFRLQSIMILATALPISSPSPTALKSLNPCRQSRDDFQHFKPIAWRKQPMLKPTDKPQTQNQHPHCFLSKGLPARQTHTYSHFVIRNLILNLCLAVSAQRSPDSGWYIK